MSSWIRRTAIVVALATVAITSAVAAVGAWLPGHVAVPTVPLVAGPLPDVLAPTVLPDPSDVQDEPFAWWEAERSRRETYRQAWFAALPNETRQFTEHPVGAIGVPLLLYRVLPEIVPDRWDDFPADVGMHPREDPGAFLTKELSFGVGANPIAPLPGYDQVRMPAVGTTCASCHRGHVIGPDGETIELLGAPNNTMNVHAYYTAVAHSLLDPRVTAEAVNDALDGHPLGWAYGPGWENQERIDRLTFSLAGTMIVDTMRHYIEEDEARLDKTLVALTYAGDEDAFRQELWGQTEVGLLLAVLTPPEVYNAPDVTSDDLAKWIPSAPGSVDYRHVWRQDQRTIGHYDGGVASKTARNVAAALGATGVPEFVHADNAIDATNFIDGLPAPAYPFPIDATKLAEGQRIYAEACASCHEGEKLIELDVIGTDPGRATAMTAAGREALIAAIRVSCGDRPECDEPDERIVKSTDAPKGYLAAPLTGVWATAPYLHNGSVPTLHHLLVPDERPAQFRRAREDYDTELVGFGWDGTDGAPWDTTVAGRSNAGHADRARFMGGIDFATDDASRIALLEYLKTL